MFSNSKKPILSFGKISVPSSVRLVSLGEQLKRENEEKEEEPKKRKFYQKN
jgi:hypothetical protein